MNAVQIEADIREATDRFMRTVAAGSQRRIERLEAELRDAAAALGRAREENRAMVENLSSVQGRCTELLDENRGWRSTCSASNADLAAVLGDIVGERFRQDAKWGAIGEKDVAMPDGIGIWLQDGKTRPQPSTRRDA